MIRRPGFVPGPDAQAIENSVGQRSTSCIWHLTWLSQLVGILRLGGLLSRRRLDSLGIPYGMSGWGSEEKAEEMKDYICCSVKPPWGMAKNKSEAKALIPLQRHLLWWKGTLFCGKWSSFGDVSFSQLLNNHTVKEFDLMFQNKYTNYPSPAPGEVLIPEYVSADEFLQCIYFFNDGSREQGLRTCSGIVLPNGVTVENRFRFVVEPARFGRGR